MKVQKVRNVLFGGVCNCFMRRVFLLLCALVSVSVFAQVPMESAVTLSVSYAPRSSAKSATKTLSSAGLIQQMGLSGGSIVCVGDASDPLGVWTFKHVLPSKVKGGSAVETDLSDKIGLEVLGYSDVGTYKSASSVAPKFQTTLGRVTRNATVKLRVEPNEGMSFEFWGGVTIGYSVVQRAGTTEAVWVAGPMSFTGAGTSVTGEGGEDVCWATVKASMGAFKVAASSSTGGTAGSGMVLVKGGTLPQGSELAGQVVGDFSIGRTEVTWGEWKAVRDWAATKGYDLAAVGGTYPESGANKLPVVNVSWYDVVKWCNARSEKEGKTAVYQANGGVYRSGEFGSYGSSSVTMKIGANGYRLPLEKEWEWAARGGVQSQGYTYSGGNTIDTVAWYTTNSGGATKVVGTKAANELGIYDMSGNVWEWVWYVDGGSPGQRIRGGGWGSIAISAEVSFRDSHVDPDFRINSYGFRVAFSSEQSAPVSPAITAQPSGGVLSNGSASLSVSTTGSGLSYQWRKDGVNISGATSASYTATAAGTYSVVVTNTAGSVTSSGAVISALPAMVLVKGGTLPQGSELAGQVVGDFSIGNYEVTWGEWKTVRDWAVNNGYPNLLNCGEGSALDHPVRNVSWFDVVKWCNAKSEMEGLSPAYYSSGNVYRSGEFYNFEIGKITWRDTANGYRLPKESEWEWAARGGRLSQGYTYAGSNDSNQVAWSWNNSQNASVSLLPEYGTQGTWPVGKKLPNELGIYDMSGNVWEWCWEAIDFNEIGYARRIRGSSWSGGGEYATVFARITGGPCSTNDRYSTNGFRVALSATP